MSEHLKPFQRDILTLRSHQWKWYIDTYPGCTFRCRYCLYGTHEGFYYNTEPSQDFLSEVERELDSLGDGKPIIYIGASTDAYQPKEKNRKITRGLLNLLVERELPIMILTKSPLILRDLDLLEKANRRGLVLVQFTLLTINSAKSRVLELGTPPPQKRLEAAAKLREAGIPVHFHVSPFIPDLYSEDELEKTVISIKNAGGTCIYTNVLGLRYSNREFLMEGFRTIDKDIEQRILNTYPQIEGDKEGVYSPYSNYMINGMLRFRDVCREVGIKSFVCETVPEFTFFDEEEFSSGIFRFGQPAVYQMMTFWKDRDDPITWGEFYSGYLSSFPLDENYLHLVKELWDSGQLFENTTITPNRNEAGRVESYQRDTHGLTVDQEKVLVWK